MAPKLSEKELELLTEEEREGLLEDEEDDGEGEGNEADAGGDGAEAADDDADEDDDGSKDDAAAASGDGVKADQQQSAAPSADEAAAGGDTAAASDEESVEDEEDQTPEWVLPNDVTEKAQAIEARKDELAKKFDEGELTAEEYRAQLRPIEAEGKEIDRQIIGAEVAKKTAIAQWGKDVSSFVKDNPQYRPGSVLHGLLDAEVRKLQAESPNPLNPRLLEKAHKTISEQIETAYKVKSTAADPPPKNNKAAAADKAKRGDPPPTLRNIPAADINDAGDGGEFAYLERLMDTDSPAYEKELAKLTPDQRDRFLAQ